jgi:hypothetical protein
MCSLQRHLAELKGDPIRPARLAELSSLLEALRPAVAPERQREVDRAIAEVAVEQVVGPLREHGDESSRGAAVETLRHTAAGTPETVNRCRKAVTELSAGRMPPFCLVLALERIALPPKPPAASSSSADDVTKIPVHSSFLLEVLDSMMEES